MQLNRLFDEIIVGLACLLQAPLLGGTSSVSVCLKFISDEGTPIDIGRNLTYKLLQNYTACG